MPRESKFVSLRDRRKESPGQWGRNAGHPVPDPTGELRALMLARLEYGVHPSVSIHTDLSFSEPKRGNKS